MYKNQSNSLIKHMDFMLIDIIVLLVSFTAGMSIRFGAGFGLDRNVYSNYLVLELAYIFIAIARNVYSGIIRRGILDEIKAVCMHILLTYGIYAIFLFAAHEAMDLSRLVFAYSFAISIVAMVIAREIWKHVIRSRVRRNADSRLMIVVAPVSAIERIIADIKHHQMNDFTLEGAVVTDSDDKDGKKIHGVQVVCRYRDLRRYLLGNAVDEVFLYIDDVKERRELVDYCLDMGITVHEHLESESRGNQNQMVERMVGYTVLTTSNNIVPGWKLMLKRLLDIIGGIVGLIATGIIYLYVAPKIKKADPGPAFFAQDRVGQNGRIFKIYKFRSMYQDAEARKAELMAQNEMEGLMFKMQDDPRILPGIGKKIRDTSLDEFPQFLNVLKGDMSLVGTRPPTVDEFDQYEPHHKIRLSYKPGITGMWQVSGRSEITDFEEVVALDNEYIENWSLVLDIKILWKTVSVVINKQGAK